MSLPLLDAVRRRRGALAPSAGALEAQQARESQNAQWPQVAPSAEVEPGGSAAAVRTAALVVAGMAAASLVLQVGLTAADGPLDGWTRVPRLLATFPVQANALIVVSCLLIARRPAAHVHWLIGAVHHAGLMGLTATALIYSVALRTVAGPGGWWALAASGLHYVVPALAVVGWLLVGPRGALRWTTALLAVLWPAGWVLFMLAQGLVTEYYPYPFVDADRFDYATVTGNSLAVVGLMAVVAAGFAVVERMVDRSRR